MRRIVPYPPWCICTLPTLGYMYTLPPPGYTPQLPGPAHGYPRTTGEGRFTALERAVVEQTIRHASLTVTRFTVGHHSSFTRFTVGEKSRDQGPGA